MFDLFVCYVGCSDFLVVELEVSISRVSWLFVMVFGCKLGVLLE